MNNDREFVRRVYDIYEETNSLTGTAMELGISPDAVRYWISNPAKFDPYIDEIAVERALLGERKVYENLTRWEADVVYEKLQEILDSTEDSLRAGQVYSLYEDAWGVPVDTLKRRLIRRVRSRVAA